MEQLTDSHVREVLSLYLEEKEPPISDDGGMLGGTPASGPTQSPRLLPLARTPLLITLSHDASLSIKPGIKTLKFNHIFGLHFLPEAPVYEINLCTSLLFICLVRDPAEIPRQEVGRKVFSLPYKPASGAHSPGPHSASACTSCVSSGPQAPGLGSESLLALPHRAVRVERVNMYSLLWLLLKISIKDRICFSAKSFNSRKSTQETWNAFPQCLSYFSASRGFSERKGRRRKSRKEKGREEILELFAWTYGATIKDSERRTPWTVASRLLFLDAVQQLKKVRIDSRGNFSPAVASHRPRYF